MNDQEIIKQYKQLRDHALGTRCACKVCFILRESYIKELKEGREWKKAGVYPMEAELDIGSKMEEVYVGNGIIFIQKNLTQKLPTSPIVAQPARKLFKESKPKKQWLNLKRKGRLNIEPLIQNLLYNLSRKL